MFDRGGGFGGVLQVLGSGSVWVNGKIMNRKQVNLPVALLGFLWFRFVSLPPSGIVKLGATRWVHLVAAA